METDKRADVGRLAEGFTASLRARGRPMGCERCAHPGAIPRGGGAALWKAFYLLFPVPPHSFPQAPNTHIPLFTSCFWANPFSPPWLEDWWGRQLPPCSFAAGVAP